MDQIDLAEQMMDLTDFTNHDESEGQKDQVKVRCCATTLKGTRCRHTTHIVKDSKDKDYYYCHTHIHNEDNPDCVICLKQVHGNKVCKLECGHVFHTKCIKEWLTTQIASSFNVEASTCPMCRHVVSIDRLTKMNVIDNELADLMTMFTSLFKSRENMDRIDYAQNIMAIILLVDSL